ncbi:hypothetical protein NUW54_g14282 [Trametes sanguinea]|uniref:Uncharacterized protein n=1 Tax=Trametes sanguinea TaxID=158606 RepID=A0ACC1ME51_9APHY|nr:hypothetical protein NUW54_g14282 [Trametes sanguinea]
MAQLEPGSYLGQAFQRLGDGDGDSSDDYSSDTSYLGSSGCSANDPSDAEPLGSGVPFTGELRHREKHRQRRHKHKWNTRHAVPTLKPEKPEPYDGRADVQIFHKFMRQMTEYLYGYRVRESMHASTISNFLTGHAYRFFVTTVSSNPRRWPVKDFFVELFNYCFPVDYRLQMRDKLRNWDPS